MRLNACTTAWFPEPWPVPCTTAGSEEAIRDKLMKDNRESSSKVNISEERKQDRAQLISEQVSLSAFSIVKSLVPQSPRPCL